LFLPNWCDISHPNCSVTSVSSVASVTYFFFQTLLVGQAATLRGDASGRLGLISAFVGLFSTNATDFDYLCQALQPISKLLLL